MSMKVRALYLASLLFPTALGKVATAYLKRAEKYMHFE